MVRERLVVVVPGPNTLRWVGRELSFHPTLVAVDRDGRPRFFGEQVLSAVAGQWDDFELVSPFSAMELSSVELTLSYMTWLVAHAPHAGRRATTALVVPTSSQYEWRSIGDRLPGETAILLRPIAVATGLGLDVDSATPNLVVDVRSDGSEVSVVCESEVLAARDTPDTDPEAIAETADAMLRDLDPDVEYDARRRGAHAIGINPESADRLAHLLEITVRVASRPERVLAGGVLTDRKLIEAYFGASRPKLGRLFHRTHRPLGAG